MSAQNLRQSMVGEDRDEHPAEAQSTLKSCWMRHVSPVLVCIIWGNLGENQEDHGLVLRRDYTWTVYFKRHTQRLERIKTKRMKHGGKKQRAFHNELGLSAHLLLSLLDFLSFLGPSHGGLSIISSVSVIKGVLINGFYLFMHAYWSIQLRGFMLHILFLWDLLHFWAAGV